MLQRYAAWFDAQFAARFAHGVFNASVPAMSAIGDWCPPPQGDCAAATWCAGRLCGEARNL
jgi:hypothetical protein